MSWNNILRLVGVYSKSYRLIAKNRMRKYRESGWQSYALFAGICALGAVIGLVAGYFVVSVLNEDTVYAGIVNFFITLPTLCVLYTLVLTQLFQIQKSGARVSMQPVYWFPVTWGEHTMASVITGMIGTPLLITGFVSCLILFMAIPMGILPIALLTVIALFASMLMTSITTEILRVLQMGVSGAISKVAGRAAVWVRFVTTLLFITVVYVVYFMFFQSSFPALIKSIADGQLFVWFLPYVWPGIFLYAVDNGMWAAATALLLATVAFTSALFVIAVRLNERYGMWEAPAVSVSKGKYAPKAGLLGRLGLSPAEAAIVKKDFKAYTRRTELMYVFITPIVFVVMTFMPMLTGGSRPGRSMDGLSSFFFPYLAVMPASILSLTLGISSLGSEGERMWFLTASPVMAKNLVRAKFFFLASLGLATASACIVVGYFLFSPSIRLVMTGAIEAVLLVATIGMASMYSGISGADFREAPRPRMIRTEWSLLNMLVCMVLAALVIMPVAIYGISASIGLAFSGVFLYFSWAISGAIALVVVYVEYVLCVRSANSRLFEAKE